MTRRTETVFTRAADRVGLHGIRAHWPEATVDNRHEAPPEALVAALLDQVEHYHRLLQAERAPRKRAERTVDRFVTAARDVLELAERERTLFEEAG